METVFSTLDASWTWPAQTWQYQQKRGNTSISVAIPAQTWQYQHKRGNTSRNVAIRAQTLRYQHKRGNTNTNVAIPAQTWQYQQKRGNTSRNVAIPAETWQNKWPPLLVKIGNIKRREIISKWFVWFISYLIKAVFIYCCYLTSGRILFPFQENNLLEYFSGIIRECFLELRESVSWNYVRVYLRIAHACQYKKGWVT